MLLPLERLDPTRGHLVAIHCLDLYDAVRPDGYPGLHHASPDVVGVQTECAGREAQMLAQIVDRPLVLLDVIDLGGPVWSRVME